MASTSTQMAPSRPMKSFSGTVYCKFLRARGCRDEMECEKRPDPALVDTGAPRHPLYSRAMTCLHLILLNFRVALFSQRMFLHAYHPCLCVIYCSNRINSLYVIIVGVLKYRVKTLDGLVCLYGMIVECNNHEWTFVKDENEIERKAYVKVLCGKRTVIKSCNIYDGMPIKDIYVCFFSEY